MPYNFHWAVKDDYTYNDYAQQETSDGKGYVSRSNHTLLPAGWPDGTMVALRPSPYKVDDYSGYVADVKYVG